MKIAIRDDDTCFYTVPAELEKAFEGLESVPISLSVVPFAVFSHAGTYPYGNQSQKQISGYADIAENMDLVDYITDGVKRKRYEVSLHGVHHEYFKVQSGEWIPETAYFDQKWLEKNISYSRQYLENLFNVRISTFVAPSNAVSPACALALDSLHMNTNCTLNRNFSRSVSVAYLRNYVSSNMFRLIYGTRLCTPQRYRGHMELASFEFMTEEAIWEQYKSCQRHNQPLVIYTHYWNLLQSSEKKNQLVSFVNYAVQDGVEMVFLSECF